MSLVSLCLDLLGVENWGDLLRYDDESCLDSSTPGCQLVPSRIHVHLVIFVEPCLCQTYIKDLGHIACASVKSKRILPAELNISEKKTHWKKQPCPN